MALSRRLGAGVASLAVLVVLTGKGWAVRADADFDSGDYDDGRDGLTDEQRAHLWEQANEMMQGHAPLDNLGELFWKFVDETDWTEPWLLGVGAFHVTLLAAHVAARRRPNVQAGLFLLTVALGYATETLNRLAGEHHLRFSQHNYFDRQGFFISMIWAGPLIVIALVSIVVMLASASSLLVSVKQSELKSRARAQAGADRAAAAAAGAATGDAGTSSPPTGKPKSE